jgi:hypothetical protein
MSSLATSLLVLCIRESKMFVSLTPRRGEEDENLWSIRTVSWQLILIISQQLPDWRPIMKAAGLVEM